MQEYINKFIDHLKQQGKSQYTIVAYRNDLGQLVRYLKEHKDKHDVQKVTLQDLKDFIEYLKTEKGFNLKTISRKINSIRSFFKYLASAGVIDEVSNPALRLVHPKVEPSPPRVLSQLEYRALRDASRKDPRLYAIVEVLLQTGLRLGELHRLKVSDIRYTSSGKPYLYIEAYGTHPARKVPLNQAAYEALKTYIEKYRPEPQPGVENIFITKTGRPIPMRNIRAMIKRAFKAAGIKKATVNDIRNTFIVYHLARGMNPLTLAKIVGHRRISTTEKYLAFVKSKPEKAGLQEL